MLSTFILVVLLLASISSCSGAAVGNYATGARGGCPTVFAFFNLSPMSPCYGTRCRRSQCQSDCDRTSACVGYEFDAYDQTIDQSGYCFMLSKSCPVPLNKIGEDYRTRWTYMKVKLTYKDDIPITFRLMQESRFHRYSGSATGPQLTSTTVSPSSQHASPFKLSQRWRSAMKRGNKLVSYNKPGDILVPTRPPPVMALPPKQVLELPDFVSIHGGCPSPSSFLPMNPSFICQGRRCQKIDCATACMSSSICIGFEFDAWDQTALSSSGYCWLLKSTCATKLVNGGEDFASRWTYLRRWEDSKPVASQPFISYDLNNNNNGGGGSVDISSMLINIGAIQPSVVDNEAHKLIHPVENNFIKVKKAGEGQFGGGGEPAIDINISNQPLVPKMHFVHGWNLQQPYMMSVGGCTSSPGGGALVYLPMQVPPPNDSINASSTTSTVSTALSIKQCLYHQCSRFDCENTCNSRSDCIGYEFAGASHGLTTVGYCHLLKRPCPADQRSEGAVFLTRLTYLKAE